MSDKFNLEERKKLLSISDYCPICEEHYVTCCKCPTHDCTCANGHRWHSCLVHNKIVIGKSDHSLSVDVCQCDETTISSEDYRL